MEDASFHSLYKINWPEVHFYGKPFVFQWLLVIAIESIFAAWILLSVVVHIPAFRGLRRLTNLGGLLPNWYLFTANLLVRDLRLRVRLEEQASQKIGEWVDVPMRHPYRVWHAMWNPRRRVTKALLDSSDAIVQARLRGKRDQIAGSVPDTLLRGWAERLVVTDAAFRFCLAFRSQQAGTVRYEIVFLSPPQESASKRKLHHAL